MRSMIIRSVLALGILLGLTSSPEPVMAAPEKGGGTREKWSPKALTKHLTNRRLWIAGLGLTLSTGLLVPPVRNALLRQIDLRPKREASTVIADAPPRSPVQVPPTPVDAAPAPDVAPEPVPYLLEGTGEWTMRWLGPAYTDAESLRTYSGQHLQISDPEGAMLSLAEVSYEVPLELEAQSETLRTLDGAGGRKNAAMVVVRAAMDELRDKGRSGEVGRLGEAFEALRESLPEGTWHHWVDRKLWQAVSRAPDRSATSDRLEQLMEGRPVSPSPMP